MSHSSKKTQLNNKLILFHINSLGRGGAERVVSILSAEFLKRGFEVGIATEWESEKEYPLAPGIKRYNVGLSEEDEKKGRISKILRRYTHLRNLVKNIKPGTVISFCNKANFRASVALWNLPFKLIVSVRNDPAVDYAPFKLATKIMKKRADGCVFQTTRARDFFGEDFAKKSTVIFNPLSDEYEKEDGFAYNAASFGQNEMKYILLVGRLTKQKNPILLLQAFNRIKDDIPDFGIKIFGDTQDADVVSDMKTFIRMNNLEDRVSFEGVSDQTSEELKKAYMFVLSSDYEGMPNALIEAMSIGIPCISTDCPCGGPAELIEDGKNGLLVPVGDADRLADEIYKVATDVNLANELADNAREIKKILGREIIAGQWIDFINSRV